MKIVALISLLLPVLVQAQDLVKTIDGAVAYCPAVSSEGVEFHKVSRLNLISQTSRGENTDVQLQVSLVQCREGQWVLDPHPQSESFHSANPGYESVQISETYKDFELQVMSESGMVLQSLPLPALSKAAAQTVKLSLPSSQNYELVLVTTVRRVAEGYMDETEIRAFGSYRLNFH